MVTSSTAPIEKATLNVPVITQEMMIVSTVPTIRQLIDFTMLRLGCSDVLSLR